MRHSDDLPPKPDARRAKLWCAGPPGEAGPPSAPQHAPNVAAGRAPAAAPVLGEALRVALQQGVAYLFARQKDDGHWCAELSSNPTVTAEYVMLRQALGLPLEPMRRALSTWLLGQQKTDGSFGLAVNCGGDVSTSAEVYLALKILGLPGEAPAMRCLRDFILARGGLGQVRIFTRIFFAMFGLFDWASTPAMPAELILLPAWCPLCIYDLAPWARGTVVPLLIVAHHRPSFALPQGPHPEQGYTDELWPGRRPCPVPYLPPWRALWRRGGWALAFAIGDRLAQAYERHRCGALRRLALRRCTAWILERQEPSGDWAGIFPPMLNNLLALPLQGCAADAPPMRLGLQALERFVLQDRRGRRVQACVSPLWDTLLSLGALCDAGVDSADGRLAAAAGWLLPRQICTRRGDWAVRRPRLPPGGWSFEYHNSWYPDIDDTAALLLAVFKQDGRRLGDPRVHRALTWLLGMQNRDGGWASFEADNDKLFLNEAPFADMKALCDPSTADVTGRLLEALGQALQRHARACGGAARLPARLLTPMHAACLAGVAYLRRQQTDFGAWMGRWGVNYLYGTSHVLCGLQQLPGGPPAALVVPALRFLRAAQNPDGGWGEALSSYDDPRLAGVGPSTASQTAWALMGLLAHAPADDPAVGAGVRYLLHQQRRGTWREPQTTATGFPGHFYVRYELYRHYFPLMALGRFAAALADQRPLGLLRGA